MQKLYKPTFKTSTAEIFQLADCLASPKNYFLRRSLPAVISLPAEINLSQSTCNFFADFHRLTFALRAVFVKSCEVFVKSCEGNFKRLHSVFSRPVAVSSNSREECEVIFHFLYFFITFFIFFSTYHFFVCLFLIPKKDFTVFTQVVLCRILPPFIGVKPFKNLFTITSHSSQKTSREEFLNFFGQKKIVIAHN